MNILIVVPQYKARVGDFYDFPLGLAYISAVIKQMGHQVTVLNMNHIDRPIEELYGEVIPEQEIDILCTGGLCVHYQKIKAILHEAKQVKPELITIVGGGLISAEPELMYEHLEMDYGVIGEGEVTIVELLTAIEKQSDVSDVNGIIYDGGNGQGVKTSAREPIEDLSQIPFPDYDGFGMDYYLSNQYVSDAYYMYPYDQPRILPVISSRSCPYKCTFCFHPLGDKYRRRPLDHFFEEVEQLIDKYQINMLAVLDETLAASKGRIKDFCDRMKTYQIKWMTQLRVSAVTDENLAMLKEAGCYNISYGIESASNEILKSMKKYITIEQIEKALTLTHKHQIGIQGNFLFSDRAETFDTVCETVTWWRKHPQFHIWLNSLVPYPGSEAYRYCVEKGLIPDRLKYIEKGANTTMNMSQMSQEKFVKVCNFLYEVRTNPDYLQLANEVSVEPSGYSSVRDAELLTFRYRCVQCGQENTYPNFVDTVGGYFKQACRSCHQRSDISPVHFPRFRRALENYHKQQASETVRL